MTHPIIIDLVEIATLHNDLRIIRETAITKGFSVLDTETFILAISEICTNAIRHASGGTLELNTSKENVLRVIISDDGPGIENVESAYEEGYSTIKGSLGLGLSVAERCSDFMQLESDHENGTVVILEKYKEINHEVLDLGLVSFADGMYSFNGDQYILKEYNGDSLLMGIIDGPGQGYDAFATANACKKYIEKNYRKPIETLLQDLDNVLRESNDNVGITASLARITPKKIIYKGYGDTHAYVVKQGKLHRLANQGGRLGQLQKFRTGTTELQFEEGIKIVLCTDGIHSLPMEERFVGSAQIVANGIFKKYRKSYGDATIFAAKYLIK